MGQNEMKARKSDPSSSQMKVGAPSNKIGARALNLEASFHGSTCSPCLSSSATSMGKPLISKRKTSHLSPALLSMLRLNLAFPLLWNVVRYAICESIQPGHVRRRDVCKRRQTIYPLLTIQTSSDGYVIPLCPILYIHWIHNDLNSSHHCNLKW